MPKTRSQTHGLPPVGVLLTQDDHERLVQLEQALKDQQDIINVLRSEKEQKEKEERERVHNGRSQEVPNHEPSVHSVDDSSREVHHSKQSQKSRRNNRSPRRSLDCSRASSGKHHEKSRRDDYRHHRLEDHDHSSRMGRSRTRDGRRPPRARTPEFVARELARGLRRTPFSKTILEAEKPKDFSPKSFTLYNGTSDPLEHLHHYKLQMGLDTTSDALMCKLFPATLQGPALKWFYQLPSNSIHSFHELCTQFIAQHLGNRKRLKRLGDLLSVRQQPQEPLRDFIRRFRSEVVQTEPCDDNTIMAAFERAIDEDSKLADDLGTYRPLTLEEVYERAYSFAQWEDNKRARRAAAMTVSARPSPPPVRRDDKRKNEQPPRDRPSKKVRPTKPDLNSPLLTIVGRCNKESWWKWPKPIKESPRMASSNQQCKYHNVRGHSTEDCNSLWDYLNDLISKGFLKEYQKSEARTQPPRDTRDRPPSPPPAVATVFMIEGGRIPDSSNQSRKRTQKAAFVQEVFKVDSVPRFAPDVTQGSNLISFSDLDLSTVENPEEHNDALVLTLRMSNFNVKRILIDTGSAVNIMFKKCFTDMAMSLRDLEESDAPLIGFNGNSTVPLGKICVATLIAHMTVMVDFLVLDVTSPYNCILGRPFLHKIQAVPSTLHQVLRFPTEYGTFEIKGDQASARKCTHSSEVRIGNLMAPKGAPTA